MSINQVLLSNTFNEFRITVNEISNTVNELTANVLSGTIVANTITTNQFSSNTISSNTISSNTITVGEVSSNLLPSSNLTFDLGSATKRWNDLYLSGTTIYLGAAEISYDGSKISFDVGGSNVFDTSNINAANLTLGTIPDARFPATLPTANGVNLTFLNASNLGTGTTSVSRGGTGVGTLNANSVILGNGTSSVLTVSPGDSGNVLISDGTTWKSESLPASGVTTGKAIAMAIVFG